MFRRETYGASKSESNRFFHLFIGFAGKFYPFIPQLGAGGQG